VKVFLSYASKDRGLAEEVELALLARGHKVFFDKASLPAGGDYQFRIESAVRESDVFVFLVSANSVASGSYALTELRFARERWPHPKDKVLPVRLDGTPWESIPPYLRAVTILEPEGSVPSEVATAVAVLGAQAAPGKKSSADQRKVRIFIAICIAMLAILAVTLVMIFGRSSGYFAHRVNLKGTWRGEGMWCILVIYKDDGKTVEGSCDNDSISHKFNGYYEAPDYVEIVITRRDQDRCEVKANGYIKIKDDQTLEMNQEKWNGGCGAVDRGVQQKLRRS
jgi:hypothetical protein